MSGDYLEEQRAKRRAVVAHHMAELERGNLGVLDPARQFDRRPSEKQHERAQQRLDDQFGVGAAEVHDAIRSDPIARRIYGCAIMALIEAER